MATLNAYLNFPGTAEEAFHFYRSVFGGEFASFQRFGDTPAGEQVPPADRSKIMHVALPVGTGMLMATDALESLGQKLTMGNNVHLSLTTDSIEESDRLFAGLSAGGTVEMPLEKTFWGAYFGSFRDKFGVQWMINHDLK